MRLAAGMGVARPGLLPGERSKCLQQRHLPVMRLLNDGPCTTTVVCSNITPDTSYVSKRFSFAESAVVDGVMMRWLPLRFYNHWLF